MQPLTSKKPCTWVAKPWPVLAAKRKMSVLVQDLVDEVVHTNVPWKTTFLLLLENYYVNITNVDITVPVIDYLDGAVGYQSAYSFPPCNPPR